MSNRNRRIKMRKRFVCHRCCAEQGAPKIYLTYKDGYGWVCPECGYEKEIKEWKTARI